MKASASPYRTIGVIPTGFASLDKILGIGGVPLRKITEISGVWSVGKSTLALTIIGQAQKQGLKTLWVDTEYYFDDTVIGYATGLGVNCDELDLLQERIAELALDGIEEWVEKHKNGVVVLDSVGGLLPRSEAEKGAEGKVIGGQAKLIATFCRKVVPLLSIHNISLIVLNHEFVDLMSGKLKTSGGEKLGYHKSIWLRLRKMPKRVMSGETQIGDIVEAEIRKNKLAATMKQSTELTLIYGDGFAKGADLMQEALDKGIITKQGQFYFYEGEKIARGLNKLREKVSEPSFSEKLQALL